MVRLYKGLTFASIYRKQLIDLVENPEYIVTVRGRPTREALNVITEIDNPSNRCSIVPGRKLNPWLALSESLWLLAGRHDVAALLPYNKNIMRFSDDGKNLYGAYGRRIFYQIEEMLERLKRDPNDRRAVLQIWNSADLTAPSKDPPCNQQVKFKVRDNKLHMVVTCRSNDLNWGLSAVNTFQFSVLQEYVAARLGVDMGTEVHMSDSLHIYTDEVGQKITDRVMALKDEPIIEAPVDQPMFAHMRVPHAQYVKDCSDVLDFQYEGEDPFLIFSQEFLQFYAWKENELLDSISYPSWVALGWEFLS